MPFLGYSVLFIGGLLLHRSGQVGLDVVAAGIYVTERRNPKLVVNSDFDPIVAELRTAAEAISGISKFNLASMS